MTPKGEVVKQLHQRVELRQLAPEVAVLRFSLAFSRKFASMRAPFAAHLLKREILC